MIRYLNSTAYSLGDKALDKKLQIQTLCSRVSYWEWRNPLTGTRGKSLFYDDIGLLYTTGPMDAYIDITYINTTSGMDVSITEVFYVTELPAYE